MYEMSPTIRNRDQGALDALKIKLSNAHSNMTYWAEQEQKEEKEVEALRNQIIRN